MLGCVAIFDAADQLKVQMLMYREGDLRRQGRILPLWGPSGFSRSEG